jgi:hypothetical protein
VPWSIRRFRRLQRGVVTIVDPTDEGLAEL